MEWDGASKELEKNWERTNCRNWAIIYRVNWGRTWGMEWEGTYGRNWEGIYYIKETGNRIRSNFQRIYRTTRESGKKLTIESMKELEEPITERRNWVVTIKWM